MNLKITYVIDEIMIVLKDVLRKYSDLIEEFGPFINKEYLDKLNEKSGKSAFVWILGTFGQHIPEAPYVLEKIIEEEQDQSSLSSIELQTYLVVASVKLFFHRAPEMQPIMAKFFQ